MSRTNDSLKLIKAARLIDGRGGAPTNNGAILVEGNPANRISDLWNVSEVFLAGKRVHRGSTESVAGLKQAPPNSIVQSRYQSARN